MLMWNKINNDEQISFIHICTIIIPTCAMHASKERKTRNVTWKTLLA